MIKTLVVAGTLLLGITAVVAQQNVAVETQNTMKATGRAMGSIAPILKGEKPYDQATVDAALAQFDDTAKKLPKLFPASLKGKAFEGDYSPSDKIWQDKAGFDSHIASFAKAVSDSKGKIKDLEALKVNLGLIGKQCGGCHETYRVKKS